MITFEYLNKEDFSAVSTELFDILADNMTIIAPTGNSREEDYKCWYKAVSFGLQREERQVILIKDSEKTIGFFQYYVNTDTLMMEEVQIKPEYQGKGLIRKLYDFVNQNITADFDFVEAYANISNIRSIGMLGKFGLSSIGLNKNGHSYHFKGTREELKNWYEKN